MGVGGSAPGCAFGLVGEWEWGQGCDWSWGWMEHRKVRYVGWWWDVMGRASWGGL